MVKRALAMAFCFSVMGASLAQAQDVHFLLSVLGGWTKADGVTGKDFMAGNGQIYNGASSTDSGSLGVSFGVAQGHGEYGFLYRRQFGEFQVTGTTTTKIGDMATDNYHGYLTYYFGDPDGKLHFYVSGGAGMTHFAPVNFTTSGGAPATVGGRSQFSSTFGAGVRAMFNSSFGFRAGVQWTPIYLTDDPDRLYCDPYWGCYLTGNPQFANQVDITAGITFRFGK